MFLSDCDTEISIASKPTPRLTDFHLTWPHRPLRMLSLDHV